MKQNSDRVFYLLTALAIVAGAALRFWHIGAQSLEFDEGYTAWLVSHSPAEIMRLVGADTAPPLYYLLLHFWTGLFGRSEAALRSLSAAASVLTLILAVDLARRILQRAQAVAVAAWMLALGFFAISYAQDARNYALLALFVIASVDCLLCYLESGRRLWLLPAAICFAAALYSHNMAIAYALALGSLWFLLPTEPSRPRRIGDMVLAGGLIVVLYLPWVVWGLPRQIEMIQRSLWVVSSPGLGTVLRLVGRLCGIGYFEPYDQWIDHLQIPLKLVEYFTCVAALALLGLAVAVAVARKGQGRRRMLALACAALLPPALVAIYSYVGTPAFAHKVFLPSASLLPICLALPLARPGRGGRVVATAAIVLIVASLFAYEWERYNQDWRAAVAVVNQFPPARRLIVLVNNDGQLPFDYYYHGSDPHTGAPAGFFDRDPPRTMLRVVQGADLGKLQSRLDQGSFDEVVAIFCASRWGDPYNLTLPMLQKRFPLEQEWDLHDVKVYRLRKDHASRIP